MTGAEMISAERNRQVREEGWDSEHDDQHKYGDLAIHAAALAVHGTDATVVDTDGRGSLRHGEEEEGDSWGLIAKHGHDEIRPLVIAGALIAAEIDRRQRRDART